jgi:hypothetical protein
MILNHFEPDLKSHPYSPPYTPTVPLQGEYTGFALGTSLYKLLYCRYKRFCTGDGLRKFQDS